MDLNENAPSDESEDEFFIVEGSNSEEIIEKLRNMFQEFPEGYFADDPSLNEGDATSINGLLHQLDVFTDSDGKIDTPKLEDFLDTCRKMIFDVDSPPWDSSQEEVRPLFTTPDFLNDDGEVEEHPLSFLDEREFVPLTHEDELDLKKLDAFFKECANSSPEQEPMGQMPLPLEDDHSLPLEELVDLVARCEQYMVDRFPHWSPYPPINSIIPSDIPFLSTDQQDIMADLLRQGKAYVNFDYKPTDFIAGLHLYEKAFPELNLNLPTDNSTLYFQHPTIDCIPGSEEEKLGEFYYDLGEISFRAGDMITFFSSNLASAYYGYHLGRVVLRRGLVALRYKNLTRETPPPPLRSKKALLLAGHCYLTGIGSVCNEEQAFLVYEKLSQEKNSPRGKLALAMCYLEGIWVDANQEIAIGLLEEAVALGNQTALYQLIFTYLLDETQESSLKKAVELAKHPLIQGQELSCFLLSLFYSYGIGIDADVDRGLYFSEKSGNYEIQTLGHELRVRIMDLI